MQKSRRLAVVSARSGSGVGGAESVLRKLADELNGRDWQVDLLTTTAESIYTWENVAEPGATNEGTLNVIRFPAVGHTMPDRDELGLRILAGDHLTMAEQYRWVNAGMRSPGMFRYIAEHGDDYHAIICGPYMFWMCLALADLAPDRTIIMPCLHDEPPAGLEITRFQMTGVRGLWFLSEPEYDLASRLGLVGPNSKVIGSAIDPAPPVDPKEFQNRFSLPEEFVLYAGRREWGKGWPELLDHLEFANSQFSRPVPLVTCGVGDVGPAPAHTPIFDLGLLSEADRTAAQAAATACLQPSAMESFSRTMVEAFQLGTPVIANAAGAVVRWHCVRSGAGLTYQDRYDFAECLRLVAEDPELLRRIGKAGPDYVAENFIWSDVIDRAELTLEAWR